MPVRVKHYLLKNKFTFKSQHILTKRSDRKADVCKKVARYFTVFALDSGNKVCYTLCNAIIFLR